MSSRPSGSDTSGAASTSSIDHFLAVARVRVLEAVARVLHLHPGEVVAGRAEQLHAPPGVQPEVGRVGRAEQAEAQPVGIVAPLALVRREEALRRGVGADHERDVAEAGEDLGRARWPARSTPDAHAAYDDATCAPFQPSACANVAPAT